MSAGKPVMARSGYTSLHASRSGTAVGETSLGRRQNRSLLQSPGVGSPVWFRRMNSAAAVRRR